jgi:NADH:ubiquinone oxidoreductase subunit K
MCEIMLNSQSFVCCISTYHQDAQGQIFVFSLAVAAAGCRRLAILVSIFRNLGSIDINNLKLKRINYNEYKFALLIISSFYRVSI